MSAVEFLVAVAQAQMLGAEFWTGLDCRRADHELAGPHGGDRGADLLGVAGALVAHRPGSVEFSMPR